MKPGELLDGLPACLAAPRAPGDPGAVQINFEKRLLRLKVTLVGPGDTKRCSKQQALVHLQAALPEGQRGDLTSIATEGDRTLFLETTWPRSVGSLGVKVVLYAAAGSVYYEATRRLANKDASGFLLVPSTSRHWRDDSVERIAELARHLADEGRDLAKVPAAFLWLRGSLAGENDEPETLAPSFNPGRVRPEHFAVYATGGEGIRAEIARRRGDASGARALAEGLLAGPSRTEALAVLALLAVDAGRLDVLEGASVVLTCQRSFLRCSASPR